MADYTTTKAPLGDVYPINSIARDWSRVEPLVDPQRLRDEFLFGIALVSGQKTPGTNKVAIMQDPYLERRIDSAVAVAEAELAMSIFPNQVDERQPFDSHEYRSMGYFRTKHRPVSSIEKLTVTSSSGLDIYDVPLEWVETGYLAEGLIFLMPLSTANGQLVVPDSSVGGGSVFLHMLSSAYWLPAFWKIRYTAGFKNGELPKVLNELIGTIAAIDILGVLAPTYAKTPSASLSIDGLSQSSSNPGQELYSTRIAQLEIQKKILVGKLRTLYGTKIFTGNI